MIEYGIIALPWWAAILAVIVAVIGAARLTRLITHDAYPPAAALRMWWDKVTSDGPWALLVHCLWCFAPWAFLAALVSFVVSFLHPGLGWAWWLFWTWMAGSYLTSQYVYFDQGRDQD